MREPTTLTDKFFLGAVLLKGLDGAVQLLGGILLIFVPPEAVTRLAHAVVTRDLVGPPTGPLAGHFEEAVRHFADGNRTFVIAYLLLHGVIKLVLVIALLRKVLPMYPVAAAALGLFVLFEILRAVQTRSIVLPLLAALDVAIIVLVVKEYLELRRQRS
ncbi:DUF2127 domain-containing protein [Saccharopolyspora hirsuta]|uniref:DUF2127 domain-containing protein n=1 Tax=Saccharopolyspora hirsuta TaxID=1837 RepID=A0A5M7BKE6_SACHI|nr:DUF2127 domain-containing protein [Saccharopolyspora hirsuta]KAA5829573.1 DUF2127 domain-containing protein [Saccharopolyspora hirsuta]MBF6511065.1 DUF2127 domain-containing protein [Nocardia farcinica]